MASLGLNLEPLDFRARASLPSCSPTRSTLSPSSPAVSVYVLSLESPWCLVSGFSVFWEYFSLEPLCFYVISVPSDFRLPQFGDWFYQCHV